MREALAAGLPPVVGIIAERYVEHDADAGLRQMLTAALAAEAFPVHAAPLPPGLRPGLWVAAERAFAAVAGVPAHQGILAVFALPDRAHAGLAAPRWALALDAVQDPGNVGALARALLAFAGAGALLLTGPTTADPFGDKALRASAGAVFHLDLRTTADLPATLGALGALGVHWWALCPRDGLSPRRADLSPPLGLVVGSEGSGVSPAVLAVCRRLTVPMAGAAESLNAAVAGGIVLYEAAMAAVGGAGAAAGR